MIEHSNIIYMPNISALGGIETYVYELVRKYKDLDICVVSKSCDPQQAKRIKKYCKLYIWNGEKIKCDVAIINYDISIIDYISENAKIYQVVHYDFTSPIYPDYDKPKNHPRITAFVGITKYLTDELGKLFNKSILSYNPLTIEEDKPIIIVSNSRLHKNKGVDRMTKLMDALDNADINYLWICITNDIDVINRPNVIFIKNRLDDDKFLSIATYVALLSNTEACSYTLNKALYRNIPILTTPLPYLDEIGYKDGVSGYTIEFDCSNIDDVVKKIKNVPKFNFKRLEDNYKNIFKNKKSKYKEELSMKVKVKARVKYYDCELEREVNIGDEWITTNERANKLIEEPALVDVLGKVEDVPKSIKVSKIDDCFYDNPDNNKETPKKKKKKKPTKKAEKNII